MCMSRLHQVLRLTGVGVAEVEDVDGARHVVSLLALDGPTPAPGEWLTVHSGYALDRVDSVEAQAVRSELRGRNPETRRDHEGEVRS
jgi:hydrogenase maturation factor